VGDALSSFEWVLAENERVLGAEHPHTVTARASLAQARAAMARQAPGHDL